MLEKFWRLFVEYVLLPLTGLLAPIVGVIVALAKRFGNGVGDQAERFGSWVQSWFGPLWDRADDAFLWILILGIVIAELVFEGWLLRRINQIKHNWARRGLILIVVVVFYLVACLQMAIASLLLGVNTAIWPIWITVTVLHVVGWAANTVLRRPFAWFWNLIRNIRPRYVIITAAGNGRKAWNYATKSDGRTLRAGDRFRFHGQRSDMLMINPQEGVYYMYANIVAA